MHTPLSTTDRALIDAYVRWAGHSAGVSSASAVANLLRIHDRLQARVEELEATIASLENEMGETAQELIDDQQKHLAEALDMAGRIAELEERLALRDLLMPHDLVQSDPGKMPTLGVESVEVVKNQSSERCSKLAKLPGPLRKEDAL